MSEFIQNDRFRRLLFSFPSKAIEILYDKYYKSLKKLATALTKNEQAAEDIVQETFVHVWEKHKVLGKEQHRSSIEHYLIRVVRNKSISYYKMSKLVSQRNTRLIVNNIFSIQEESVQAIIIEKEKNQFIREIIKKFPRREVECLLMKLDDEMSNTQIATTLKISLKAVERSITSANKRLRKYNALLYS